MELIHSEDREEFKRQLSWNSALPNDKAEMPLHEVLLPGAYILTSSRPVPKPPRTRRRIFMSVISAQFSHLSVQLKANETVGISGNGTEN